MRLVNFLILIFGIVILALAVTLALEVMNVIVIPEQYSVAKYLGEKRNDYDAIDDYTPNNKGSWNITPNRIRKESYNNDENLELDVISSGNNGNSDIEDNSNDDEQLTSDELFVYKRYYYSQLDSNARKLYDGIINNLDEVKTGLFTVEFGKEYNDLLHKTNGEEILNEYFQSAVNAILLDNPEIFYLDITKMYLLTKSTTYTFTGTTYEVSIGPVDGANYLLDGFSASNLKDAENKLAIRKKAVVDRIKGTPEEKIKKVHDYLVDKLDYDDTFSEENIYNMYGALVSEKVVCEGYAKAFKGLMDELKIPCVVVCGEAENSKGDVENHAWNYVRLNGKWYAVDTTWDDPILIGSGTVGNETKYKYFLRGSNTLFKDHTEDGNVVSGASFSYPKLEKNDY